MANKPDRNEIYQAMELKSSEQLLQIWVENDHVSWHDEVFDVINEILENREEEIPEQQEAIFDEVQREKNKKKRESSKQESTLNFDIYKDEEQPVFYNPKEILQYVSKLKYIAFALMISTILSTLISVPEYVRGFLISFPTNEFQEVIIWVVIIIAILFILIVQAFFYLLLLSLIWKDFAHTNGDGIYQPEKNPLNTNDNEKCCSHLLRSSRIMNAMINIFF